MKNPDETAMVNMPNPIRTAQTASRSLSVMGRTFRSFTGERKCFTIRSSPPNPRPELWLVEKQQDKCFMREPPRCQDGQIFT